MLTISEFPAKQRDRYWSRTSAETTDPSTSPKKPSRTETPRNFETLVAARLAISILISTFPIRFGVGIGTELFRNQRVSAFPFKVKEMRKSYPACFSWPCFDRILTRCSSKSFSGSSKQSLKKFKETWRGAREPRPSPSFVFAPGSGSSSPHMSPESREPSKLACSLAGSFDFDGCSLLELFLLFQNAA